MKLSTQWLYLLIFLPAFHSAAGQEGGKKASILYDLGERAYMKGNYEDALGHFNQCVVIDAGYYEAYTSRAAVKERLQDWPGAITDYSIYLDKFPDHRETLFSRGLAFYQASRYEQALKDFKHLSRLPPDKETQAIFYRQSPYGGTDQIISARGQMRDYVLSYIGLAAFRMKLYDEAILCLDSAIYLNPREADYYVHRGLVKEELNYFKEAEADYRKALELNNDHAIAFHNLGVLLRKNNNLDEAEFQLNMAIERNPKLSYSYLERAFYRQEKGNLQGALTDYNQALKLDRKNPDSWVNRGMVKEKLRDLSGAYDDFTRAIEIKGNFEKAWFCRGNVLSKMNKLTEAAEDYTVAILHHPAYGHAYHNRAVINHRLGKLTEACEDVKSAELYGMKVSANLKGRVCRE